MSGLSDDGMPWIAQRERQDWRDETVIAALDWLTSLVPQAEWKGRYDAVDARFQAAKNEWAAGRRVALYDPVDAIAWYAHQARRYADPLLRPDFFLPEGYRIAPLFRRIGQLLPDLRNVDGVDGRAARLMTANMSQPDDGLYELLVAGTYARRGWDKVEFVPEAPGLGRRPDLYVIRGDSHWAIECKRAGRSGYARDERLAGERMAERCHALARTANRSIIVLTQFSAELHLLGDNYLAGKVESFITNSEPLEWNDEGGQGIVVDVDWDALHRVMIHDDIYFGSSRMFELLVGRYETGIDFSVSGDWTPAEGRPLHAEWVDRVSVVGWLSLSDEAARRKAMHFRSLVARASEQLIGSRRGVVHVGYEAVGGNSADARRHQLNTREMQTFAAGDSGLRMVYGNYFTPELVTARNESSAVSETTATYRVGSNQEPEPLPGHLLFTDDDGKPGSHLL